MTQTNQSSNGGWKPLILEYDYKGQHVKEEAYLTIDLEEPTNQIVVVPTAGILLASQPGETCNLASLREQAKQAWNKRCTKTT
jgi:hypothetical protein